MLIVATVNVLCGEYYITAKNLHVFLYRGCKWTTSKARLD